MLYYVNVRQLPFKKVKKIPCKVTNTLNIFIFHQYRAEN